MDDAIFVESKCKNNQKVFYIKYYKGADEVWVLARGEKSIANEQQAGGMSSASLDISQIRISPRYSCPYCGNRGFVQCGACNKITCYGDSDEEGYCAHCSVKLQVKGAIKSMRGDSTRGQ